MTKLEIMTVLYSVEELLEIEDPEAARQKALNVIRKVLKEAESASK